MVVPFVYTEEEYKKLEEERDFYKEQAILWRNDYKNEYEENKKLKSDLSLVIKERDDNIEQNKKLNERIKELEQCNLNLQTWIDNKEKVNKSLREENRRLSDFLECES